jgi:hypothetical protein
VFLKEVESDKNKGDTEAAADGVKVLRFFQEHSRDGSRKKNAKKAAMKGKIKVFKLCWHTQQPSLTFRLVGGSMYGLWPLFHLRDGGKRTEMTATQHGGTLRH